MYFEKSRFDIILGLICDIFCLWQQSKESSGTTNTWLPVTEAELLMIGGGACARRRSMVWRRCSEAACMFSAFISNLSKSICLISAQILSLHWIKMINWKIKWNKNNINVENKCLGRLSNVCLKCSFLFDRNETNILVKFLAFTPQRLQFTAFGKHKGKVTVKLSKRKQGWGFNSHPAEVLYKLRQKSANEKVGLWWRQSSPGRVRAEDRACQGPSPESRLHPSHTRTSVNCLARRWRKQSHRLGHRRSDAQI